jgi:hypothetical protein
MSPSSGATYPIDGFHLFGLHHQARTTVLSWKFLPGKARGRRRLQAVIALLIAGALFMEQLDGTVIATALPQMADTFGVAAVDLNIGISAYLLTVAVFIPASG